MEEKDLIKKLEEVSLPEIELPSHKRRLKVVLLEKYFQEKRKGEIFNLFKIFLPVGTVTVLLIGLFLNDLIFPTNVSQEYISPKHGLSEDVLPKYNSENVRKIVLDNSQIKDMIEKGATIKNIEIIGDKANVLIQSIEKIEKTPSKTAPTATAPGGTEETGKKEEIKINTILVKVNLKENKIEAINFLEGNENK